MKNKKTIKIFNLVILLTAGFLVSAQLLFAADEYLPGTNEEEWEINSQILKSTNEPEVIGYLADQRNSVRFTACIRLAEIGTNNSLNSLQIAANSDQNSDVKIQAQQAYYKVGYRQQTQSGQEDVLLAAIQYDGQTNGPGITYIVPVPPETFLWAMDLLGERGVSRAKPDLQAIIYSTRKLSEQLKAAARENIALIEFINSHSPDAYIDLGLISPELRTRRFALDLLVKQHPENLFDRLNQLLVTAQQNQDFEFIYYLSQATENERARIQFEPIEIELPADKSTFKTSSVQIVGYTYGEPFRENFKLNQGANKYTKTVTLDGVTTQKSITINRKDPPAIIFNTIPAKSIAINKTLTFKLSASNPDPDNSNLVFFIYDLPEKADFNYSTKTFTWTPKKINAGNNIVLFVADDGYGHTLQRQAKITVSGANSSAPTNLKITSNQAEKIGLSWKDNSGIETSFRVMRAREDIPDWFIEVGTVNANVATFDDNTIEPKTQYRYRVCAYNADGDSAYSNVVQVTTQDSAPDAPSQLAATVVSSTKISLSWVDNSSNESGFKLQRSLDAGFNNPVTIALAADTMGYDDTGLLPNTIYYYRIYTFNNIGNSAYSNTASAATPENTPVAPSDLTAVAIASNHIDLNWRDNSQAEDGFKLEKSTYANFSDKIIIRLNANTTSYVDMQCNSNTKYHYRIYAYNNKGDSAYSNVVFATTPEDLPLAPTGLTATAVSMNQVDLQWSDNSNNETSFNIYRRTGTSGSFTLLYSTAVNVARYTDNTVVASTLYYYRVKAANSAGESNYSEASVTTPSPLNAPTNLMASAVSSSRIDLSWSDSNTGEDGFEVWRSTSATGTYSIAGTVAAGTNLTFANTGLNPQTTYYYKVRAVGAGINIYSDYSNIANATTPAILVAPINLGASATSSSTIYMSWSDTNANETGFEVYRAASSAGTYGMIGTVGPGVNLNFTNTGLTAQTTYYYKVRAYKTQIGILANNIYSGYSNVANATIPTAVILTAVIETDKNSGKTPLRVNFSAAKSSCSGGQITSYAWNFGDNSQNGVGQGTAHTFLNMTGSPRAYTVVLIITSDKGTTQAASKTIFVNP